MPLRIQYIHHKGASRGTFQKVRGKDLVRKAPIHLAQELVSLRV